MSEGERVRLLATLGYIRVALSRSGLCVWMEVYKEAFRSGDVLADDYRSVVLMSCQGRMPSVLSI